eukprot:4811332-Amphidinium_carterae.1
MQGLSRVSSSRACLELPTFAHEVHGLPTNHPFPHASKNSRKDGICGWGMDPPLHCQGGGFHQISTDSHGVRLQAKLGTDELTGVPLQKVLELSCRGRTSSRAAASQPTNAPDTGIVP